LGSFTIKRKKNEKNRPMPPTIANASQGFISAVNLKRRPIVITSPITRPTPCIETPFPIESL